MKAFICILALLVSTAHAGFLQKSRGPRPDSWPSRQQGWQSAASRQQGWQSGAARQQGWQSGTSRQQGWQSGVSRQQGWQSQPPQVIKVIHSQAPSNPHGNTQSGPVKIVKVIQDSGPTVADLRSSNVAPSKIIRVIHHDDGPSGDYGRSAGGQDAKIVKVIKESSANSYSAPEEQDVKVYKVFKQNDDASSSYGSTYANGWSQGRSAQSPVVKVIKVVEKQPEYAARSKW